MVDAQDPRAASGLICSQSATVQWRVAASFTRSQPVFTSRGICRAQSLPSTVLIRCVQSFRSATFPAWLFKASSFFLHLFDYRFYRALAAGTAATRMQTSVSAESVAWRRRPQVGIGTCAAAPWWPTWLTVTTVTILTCNKLTHVTWGAFDWSYSGIRIRKSFVLISSTVIFGYIWIFHFKQWMLNKRLQVFTTFTLIPKYGQLNTPWECVQLAYKAYKLVLGFWKTS